MIFHTVPNRVGSLADVLYIAADFLGPLNRFMVHTTTRAKGNNLTAVFHRLAGMKGDKYGDPILDGIARVASCRSWVVRNGDVGLHDSPDSTNYNMTVLANVCMLLKFARVASEDTAEARYEQKFGDNGEDVDGRLYGFTVDDWFRGVYTLLVFRNRRSARLRLDTPKGQFTVRAEHVGYWHVAESRSLPSADEHSMVPKNALLGDMVRDMLDQIQTWCPAGTKESLFKKYPELMDLVVADGKLFDGKQDGPSEGTGSGET